MTEEAEPSLDPHNVAERRTLKWVLGINFTQVAVAGTVGIVAQSTGLGIILKGGRDILKEAGEARRRSSSA